MAGKLTAAIEQNKAANEPQECPQLILCLGKLCTSSNDRNLHRVLEMATVHQNQISKPVRVSSKWNLYSIAVTTRKIWECLIIFSLLAPLNS